MPRPEIVLIDWVDSCSVNGWQSSEDCKSIELICQTVGFFVHETKNIYTIAQSQSKKDGFRPFAELISIPKSSIIKTVKLKE